MNEQGLVSMPKDERQQHRGAVGKFDAGGELGPIEDRNEFEPEQNPLHFQFAGGQSSRRARPRDELRPGHRSSPVGEYLILYCLTESSVQIWQVVHRRRNIEALFSQ